MRHSISRLCTDKLNFGPCVTAGERAGGARSPSPKGIIYSVSTASLLQASSGKRTMHVRWNASSKLSPATPNISSITILVTTCSRCAPSSLSAICPRFTRTPCKRCLVHGSRYVLAPTRPKLSLSSASNTAVTRLGRNVRYARVASHSRAGTVLSVLMVRAPTSLVVWSPALMNPSEYWLCEKCEVNSYLLCMYCSSAPVKEPRWYFGNRPGELHRPAETSLLYY